MTPRSLGAVAALVLAVGCSKRESNEGAPVPDASASLAVDAAPATAPAEEAPSALKPSPACTEPAVDFHGNAGLEREVRRALGRDAGPVAPMDLTTIVLLNLSSVRQDSLDPCIFGSLVGATTLFLGPGDLKDIGPLAPLTQLTTLQVYVNKVEDITPLAKMAKLQRLDLENTHVKDLAPLKGLKELVQLQIDNDPVTDLTPLANHPMLARLSLRHTQVTDLSPLKTDTKLESLYIEGAPIADPSALGALEKSGLKVIAKGQM
jgi:hypothetical protein